MEPNPYAAPQAELGSVAAKPWRKLLYNLALLAFWTNGAMGCATRAISNGLEHPWWMVFWIVMATTISERMVASGKRIAEIPS